MPSSPSGESEPLLKAGHLASSESNGKSYSTATPSSNTSSSNHIVKSITTPPDPSNAGESNENAVQVGTAPILPDEEPPLTPEARRRSLYRWAAFWFAVSVLVAVLLVMAAKQGDGKIEFDWKKALQKAGGGGLAGALAMVIQVLTLMPLRTVMNYQYRYGGTMVSSTKILFREGGFGRYYSGLGPALFQGPIARFGDTAANAGILALLSSNPFLNKLPSPLKTAFASVAAALFRMILVPVDTLKTTMQTQGKDAVKILKERIKAYGLGTLWYGAWATAAASFVGSFPWFATYNYLSEALPPPHSTVQKLARQAFIGFVASVVSDTISNSLRVLKTYRQVNQTKISYSAAAKRIVQSEGLLGLFGRGLGTRILANGLQGLMFSVLWKLIQDAIEKKYV